MTDLYNVVMKGKAIAGWDNHEVKTNLAKIFKEPPDKMERLLTGKPVTVKKKVSQEQAAKIIKAIEKAGAECKIVKYKTPEAKPLEMEENDKPDSNLEKDTNLVPDRKPARASRVKKSPSKKSPEINPYKTPKANLAKRQENNSGQGKDIELPDGIKGWSWGAFLWNWIWAIGNRTWIGLFALVPYVGFVFAIVLGIKGRQWAWQNKHWDSIEHFQRVQKKWSFWGVLIIGFFSILGIIGILAAILIPMFVGNHQM